MTIDTNLLLANPDPISIRGSLVAFLKAQARFRDYDFDGSNLSVVLDILAYNAYQTAFMTSMVASEMFMDTAQQRSSIISHAKELGYTPRSIRGARATVTIEIHPTDTPGAIVVPKGTKFSTTVGSRAFTFATDRSHLVVPIAGRYVLADVDIYEGFELTDVFTVNSAIEKQKFTLSNAAADTRSLSVVVDGLDYKNATSIIDLSTSSHVYFLQLNGQDRYELVFGDDVLGLQPKHQSVIKATYVVTAADAANGARTFRAAGAIAGYPTITVTTTAPAAGGAVAEVTESIRRNAQQVYQTRNRAVTANDYKILLKQEFPEIQAINVYGGELMDPPQYGRVYISVDVEGALGATDNATREYHRYIRDKSPLTIEPVFISPSYLFLNVSTRVYYDYVKYDAAAQDIEAAVLNAIQTFNETTLNNFDISFKYSQLVSVIDNAHPAILSNDTDVLMTIALNSDIISAQSQKIYFNGNSLAQTANKRAVTSSTFSYDNKTCMLMDDYNGGLQIVTNIQNKTPTVIGNVGTVQYDTGVITVEPFALQQLYGSSLKIYAQPASKNVNAVQNALMNIDLTEISIQAVASKQ